MNHIFTIILLGGFTFVFTGAFFIIFFGVRRGKKNVQWPTVRGKILSMSLTPALRLSRRGQPGFWPVVTYSYEVGGQQFTGNKISALQVSITRSLGLRMMEGSEPYPYTVGQEVDVHCDPSAASNSVLMAGSEKWMVVLLWVNGAVAGIALIALYALIWGPWSGPKYSLPALIEFLQSR